MSFTPKVWVEDDPITPAELNRIEDGIDDAHTNAIEKPIHVGRYAYQTQALQGVPGWSATKAGTGIFSISHGLGHVNYSAVVTIDMLAGDSDAFHAVVWQRQANAIVVQTYDQDWTLIDGSFSFVVRVF